MMTLRRGFSRSSWLRSVVPAMAALMASAPSTNAQQPRVAALQVVEGYFQGADSVRLFFRKVGAGPTTAVYLHGGPGSSMADGGYELDELAVGRTLIAFDQRSGGRSQHQTDTTRLNAEYFIRDLESLRVHFGLERMTLIGQSWGAMLAAMYTARHPTRVERLLLLSPGPPTRAYGRLRTARTNAVIGETGVARIAALTREMAAAPDSALAALCQERIALIFRMYLTDVTALRRMRVGYCDGTPAALRYELWSGNYLQLGEYDFLPQLALMEIPALVMEGAETKVPLEATSAWAAALPHGRLLLIPGTNHILWLEGDVQRTKLLLRQFLDGQWPQGAQVVRQ